jgi:hypothetical protein
MRNRTSSLANIRSTLFAAMATVACGGSVQPSATAAEPAAVATDEAGSGSEAAEPGASREAGDTAVNTQGEAANLSIALDAKGELVLNDVTVFAKGSAGKLAERIGPPTREKAHKRGETSLYHDRDGFVLWAVDGEVKGVGVNFNWDGDEKFPEASFPGNLVLGALKVGRTTTPAQFESLPGYSVKCQAGAMCAGKSESVKFLAAFDKGVITQLSFLAVK